MKVSNMKHRVFTASIITVAVVSGLVAFNVRAADEKATAGKPAAASKPALTVVSTKPVSQEWPLKLSVNGNVTAWQEASVGAQSNGLRLADVKVNVGDFVRKGQVLATFATDTVQAEVAQSRASVAEAEAGLALAQADAERARALQASGALSAQQINQLLTTERTATAKLEAAKAANASQLLRLNQTSLRAPDSGVISARMATVGAVVPAGSELFKLIRQNRLEWRAEVTSAELGKVRKGAIATLTTPSGEQVKGKVRVVAPTVDTQSRNGLVYIDLPRDSAAKAGMFARGELELGSAGALTLPQQALVLRDGFSYVFRIEPNNKVSQNKVTVGRRNGDRVEILDGVKAEQQFVATGASFLADGDTVRIGTAITQGAAAVSPNTAAK
jgi:HlyD family secretion protein